MENIKNPHDFFYYVSTRASYDPAKTIYVCAPERDARSYEGVERFARESGWRDAAEYDGAILVMPICPNGWNRESVSMLGDIYDSTRNSFETRNGKSLIGREKKLWCWETLVYLVGYEEGAEFAGSSMVANPNRFAASVLINGAPSDYSLGDSPSSHWMVKNVSSDYSVRNNQIPSCLWLIGAEKGRIEKAVKYFSEGDGFEETAGKVTMGSIPAIRYANADNPAQQLLISQGGYKYDLSLAHTIMTCYFDHIIRWKNGPDGMLAEHPGYTDFYSGKEYIHNSVTVNALEYSYSVKLPKGMDKFEAEGLPLLFSVHGRGEPAWLFATKNGWDTLCDKTKEFVLVVPDSPGNIWNLERDGEAFKAMILKICQEYKLDTSRVYLTGFSNGGAITREVGSAYPWLFAAIAPYNAPTHVPHVVMDDVLSPSLLLSGYELPYWVYVGDNDPAAGVDVDEQLDIVLKANHCSINHAEGLTTRFQPDEIRTGHNYYTLGKGYKEGERFHTLVYKNKEGQERVGYTVMKNMPHGAIREQSKATWEFLRHFSRSREGVIIYR